MRDYAEVILEFGNRYHNGLVDLVLNIHICYDKIGILFIGCEEGTFMGVL
jgi:hypothetical protein